MLRTMDDLEDYSIGAIDGTIGRVKDFYFDDQRWLVRYFVVNTGPWLGGRRVLISTLSIREPNWLNRLLPVSMSRQEVKESPDIEADHHLRSCKMVMSSHIRAPDGDVGHVCGFLIDEENWALRYLIVDTRNWWLGHQILIAPQWIDGAGWEDRTVSVKLTRETVRKAPPYWAKTQVDRDAEMQLYDYYGLPGYWAHQAELQNPLRV